MKCSIPADADQRQLALNPTQSFIVQAPAGSGKTELLVRRFLVLLTCVSFPEAIVAITFTRKAANEMRLRIMQSLDLALNNKAPADNDKQRYELAKKVLIHDKALAWNLLSNPNRLRILTIDSFCLYLTRQMPLLAGLSESLIPVEHPEYLYRLASRALLQQLEDKVAWQASLSHLLSHLDNDFQRLEALFIPMLARREQWLDFLLQHQRHLREDLEQALLNINHHLVQQLNGLISQDMAQALFQQLNFSLQQCQQTLLIRHDDLNFWQAASHLLLTTSNRWREKLTQAEGFPPHSALKNEVKTRKEQCLNLITELSQIHSLRETLIALKQAPPLRYSDSQWQIIQSLFELLPVLVAHLKVIFQQQKKLDYTEISLAASAALGQSDNPSDLALVLDYQIQHLLVDEFQDTSNTQFQLIEKLTAGWQPHESRSLFLVGDPMQSIYRFRKAEVGLFSQVQRHGIGNIPLQSLSLSVNFRSTSGIIDWVNQQFSQLIANASDVEHEHVCYAPATAYSQTKPPQAAVCTYWQQANEASDLAESTEAEQLVKIIQTLKREDNQATIAILIRARSHLRRILPALQNAAITYRAIAIDSLADKSAVQDLLSLTRALHHLGDRIAWFALLHSPYCGLSLLDLYHISQFDPDQKGLPLLWQQLQQFEEIPLNTATKQRLRRIVPVLRQSIYQQGRLPFTDWVKNTWLALGGPTTLVNEEEMDPIQAFFNFLENKIKQEGEALDFFNLEAELAHIYAQSTAPLPSHAVEIMTIHQAKGLEYDHVILPGLQRRGRSEQAALLLFCEKRFASQKKQFLLAPIKSASHEDPDGIYNYLYHEEKQKNAAELTRLLYVACTRAKQSLHLLGTLNSDTSGEVKSPPSNSLLGQLWPIIGVKPQYVVASPVKKTAISSPQGLLKRLPADWQAPYSAQLDLYSNAKNLPSAIKAASNCYRWQLYPERGLGIVIHQLLYQISQEGLAQWNKERILAMQPILLGLLSQQGLLAEQLPNALATLNRCLETTLADPRGRWILSSQHQAAQSEYAITALFDNQPKNLVIDRTFIEADTGITWIIDYKTRDYQGNQPEVFLNLAKKQHQSQLNTYAQALMLKKSYHDQSLHCGLYFPLRSLWCEWEFNEISLTESHR